jgi:exodeoxyribonuclease V alpha subunit
MRGRPLAPLPARALGPDLVARLREAGVPDETLGLADEAASWAAGLAPPERQALALVVVALSEARAEGSTRLPLAALGDRLARLDVAAAEREAALALAATLAPASTGPAPALAALVGAPGDYRPFIVDGGFLQTQRDRLAEERLAASLAARLRRPDLALDVAALEAAVARAAPPGRAFSREQEAALRTALRRPLTIVTGGPGSGKTALVAGIVRALLGLGVAAADIALAAPTGKAANRIAETLAGMLDAPGLPEPRTLHRLLGFRGGGARLGAGEVRHHENHPLPYAVVVVDETSMVDLALMERLARAVRPDARLVLLGDADQLPSVDAGAVFRDLRPLAVALTESHRMSPADPAGAAVLGAARAVGRGELAGLPPPAADPAALAFAGFERLEPAGPAPAADRRLLAAFLDRWYEARVRSLPGYDDLAARVHRPDELDGVRALLRHHQRARLLAPARGAFTPAGADALNLALARRAGAGSSPGTPVLMTRNDYPRGLFNGDQGVLVRVAARGEGARLVAAFPRGSSDGSGIALFPYEGLRHDLQIAYASTVHKAQGAELEHAALILPEHDLPLISRELLYTALTRARRSVVVVGRLEILARGAARPLERASGLGDLLDVRRGG